MALVDTTTGEIVADLSPDEARDLTNAIRGAVEGVWELISHAYEQRAWVALGYGSWDDYCSEEFGGSRLRLPREDREDVVGSLRDAGLSTRAIGAALGVDAKTVRNDLRRGGENSPPALSRCQVAGHGWHGGGPCPGTETTTSSTKTKTTTGTDGKTYTPKPKPELTPEQQRDLDIADGYKRAARGIEKLTDFWPYFWSFVNGRNRTEIEAEMVQPTLDAIAAIEEQMRDYH